MSNDDKLQEPKSDASDAQNQESVERALIAADEQANSPVLIRPGLFPTVRILAAEVRRLREVERKRAERVYNSGALQEECDRLRAELELKSKTSAEIALENVRLREENTRLRRIEQVHSCGGGPTPCGGCCACLEAQYPEPHDYQRMQAKLARVEALPARLRQHGQTCESSLAEDACEYCAEELEAALKGE